MPYELKSLILYRHGGLEHPTAKIMKDAIAEHLAFIAIETDHHWIADNLAEELDFDSADEPYQGGMTYRDFLWSHRLHDELRYAKGDAMKQRSDWKHWMMVSRGLPLGYLLLDNWWDRSTTWVFDQALWFCPPPPPPPLPLPDLPMPKPPSPIDWGDVRRYTEAYRYTCLRILYQEVIEYDDRGEKLLRLLAECSSLWSASLLLRECLPDTDDELLSRCNQAMAHLWPY